MDWPALVSRLRRWITNRNLDLFVDYLKAIYAHWNEFLWESILLAPYAAWLLFGTPPMLLTVVVVGGALVAATYYAWRADRRRLIPQLGFTNDLFLVEVGKTDSVIETAWYVQILPKCLTDSPVSNCRARLLKTWLLKEGQWTEFLTEPVPLTWSLDNHEAKTLYPDVPDRLNVVWASNLYGFYPATNLSEQRLICKETAPMRFDIAILPESSPSVVITVEAQIVQWGDDGRQGPVVNASLLNSDTQVHREKRRDGKTA